MPHHIAVLPEGVISALVGQLNACNGGFGARERRFLMLPHPRTGLPTLFLPVLSENNAKDEILEVQAISPSKPRSWFMPEGEVVDDGKLLLLTPIDPSFLLISVLQSTQPTDGSSGNYRSLDDIFEDAASKIAEAQPRSLEQAASCSVDDILQLMSLACIQNAMRCICKFKKVATDIIVYRYSHEKAIEYLHTKVARLAKPEICEVSKTVIRQLAKDGLMDDEKETLLHSARVKAACDLVSQYISPETYSSLLAKFDFAELQSYLQAIQTEQAAAAAEATNSGNAKKSKSKNGDTAEKKRKAQSKASQGVEKLKKANVKGMAKISSFFQKPDQ
ncbi:uncharacterized protein LAESUDRAFT_697204 [Laetiporus sulphureus 93-53]|uniref:Ribonuclease H2 subunit B n=1 Tax=Laetiporus sulphureus 93-53 TaxID=1314785 RepID=A0A165F443_9APHY|nr:uncharacterized protein LAESUDRAFT_697204 [Laetiporus sulphureus 93-53]KZT08343.1 hypothetical protein LAESUDRAFT_697204 [Laetiporus sulphureus 93-53]